jgi:hypothetical protein
VEIILGQALRGSEHEKRALVGETLFDGQTVNGVARRHNISLDQHADFKTIADFRKDNGAVIRKVCRAFVLLCRRLDLLSDVSVAIDARDLKFHRGRDEAASGTDRVTPSAVRTAGRSPRTKVRQATPS